MQKLSWVKIEKTYVLEGPEALVTLLEIFEGRQKLIIHHFAFDTNRDEVGANSNAVIPNAAWLAHLHDKNTTYVMVSCVSQSQIEAYKQRMGWTVPWYSSLDSDFNDDFYVTTNEREQAGVSVFLRDGKCIYHASSLAKSSEAFRIYGGDG